MILAAQQFFSESEETLTTIGYNSKHIETRKKAYEFINNSEIPNKLSAADGWGYNDNESKKSDISYFYALPSLELSKYSDVVANAFPDNCFKLTRQHPTTNDIIDSDDVRSHIPGYQLDAQTQKMSDIRLLGNLAYIALFAVDPETRDSASNRLISLQKSYNKNSSNQ